MDDSANSDNWSAAPEWTAAGNESSGEEHFVLLAYPLDYRVIATIVQALIFLFGTAGNIVVIVVICKTKSLQSPTYTYLISLAVADLIVLVSAVPEAIVVHHIGKRWLAGQLGCSLFIFANFLGINAGSLNILAFTLEQYVAVVCEQGGWRGWLSRHSKLVVVAVWLFAILYCCPWLGLTQVRQEPEFPFREQCELRLSREQYLGLFGADFLLFYIIPLLVAVICYSHIALYLVTGPRFCPWDSPSQSRASLSAPGEDPLGVLNGSLGGRNFSTYTLNTHCQTPIFNPPRTSGSGSPHAQRHAVQPLLVQAARQQLPSQTNVSIASRARATIGSNGSQKGAGKYTTPQSRKQVLRMLVIIVVLFAVAWLPFRGLLIYNSFAQEPWMDIWYLFCAKTLIYFNSAMNPLLYNIMSRRFRLAFNRIVLCKYNAEGNKAVAEMKRRIKRNHSKNSTANSRSHIGHDALLLYA